MFAIVIMFSVVNMYLDHLKFCVEVRPGPCYLMLS